MKYLVNIENRTGFPAKAIISTVCAALVIGIIGFSYKNASLPAQQKQINEIQVSAKSNNDRYNRIEVKTEIIQNDMSNVKENVKDMKEDLKEIKKGQDKAIELIINVLRNKGEGLTRQ